MEKAKYSRWGRFRITEKSKRIDTDTNFNSEIQETRVFVNRLFKSYFQDSRSLSKRITRKRIGVI